MTRTLCTIISTVSLLFALGTNLTGQRLEPGIGHVRFVSRAPLDTIVASQDSLSCHFDVETGKISFSIPMGSFLFRHPMAQKHFNSFFLETELFPRAVFEGVVIEFRRSELTNKKEMPVRVRGTMSLHGTSKELVVNGVLKLQDKALLASSSFLLKTSDFGIEIPSLLRDNIAETVEITVTATWTDKRN